jgi:hypothetical protein
MAITPYAGFVDYVGNHATLAQHPVPTWLQNAAANNMVHAAAMSAQVWINWLPPDGTDGLTLPNDGSGSPSRTDYTPLLGPLPLRIHSTRGPFRLRVRLAGYETAAGSQTLRLVIAPASLAAVDAIDGGDNTADFTVPGSGSAAAWIDTTPKVIVIGSGDPRAEQLEETITTDGAGTGTGVNLKTRRVRWSPQTVSVWNVSATPTITCRLSGLYIAEYVGP